MNIQEAVRFGEGYCHAVNTLILKNGVECDFGFDQVTQRFLIGVDNASAPASMRSGTGHCLHRRFSRGDMETFRLGERRFMAMSIDAAVAEFQEQINALQDQQGEGGREGDNPQPSAGV